MGVSPKTLDGLCQGKSHLEMDDSTGGTPILLGKPPYISEFVDIHSQVIYDSHSHVQWMCEACSSDDSHAKKVTHFGTFPSEEPGNWLKNIG